MNSQESKTSLFLYYGTRVYGSQVANKRHILHITFHTIVVSIFNRIRSS